VVYWQQSQAARDTGGMAEGKKTVRTTVLLPARVHAALKRIAERDHRSMHQEIIYALERFVSELEGEAKEERNG